MSLELTDEGFDVSVLREVRARLLNGGAAELLVPAQLLQQRFRLLQVFRIKPFGELAVELGQHLPGFVLLVLLLQVFQPYHCLPRECKISSGR